MKNMEAPNILIWEVALYSRESGNLIGQEFFLFKKRAEKYIAKHKREWEEYCDVLLGGNTLWLW